jgi:sugar phosphate permease
MNDHSAPNAANPGAVADSTLKRKGLSPEPEPPTMVRYGVLAFLAAMMFVLYLDRYCISQAAPLIEKDLGISHAQMGYIFAAFTLSYALFEYWTGHWGDRYGSRGVLARIVVWWSVFTALTGAATGFWMLIWVRFLFGAGEAGALPNSARVLKKWFPESVRGRIQGFVTTFMMVGGAAAPKVSQQLFNVFGWRWTFVAFGLLGLVWAITFYLWFRDEPREHASTNEAECRLIAEQDQGETHPPIEAETIAPDLVAMEADDHHPMPWAAVLSNPNVRLLAVAMITMSAVSYALFSWYPTYLQEARGTSKDLSGTLASVVLGVGAVGCLLGGWLADRLVRLTGSLRWGSTCQSVAGTVLVGLGILFGVSADSLTWSVVFIAVACFGVQVQVPAWWACATKISGHHLGAVFGLMNMVGAAGAISSQILLGEFATRMRNRGFEGRAQWDAGLYAYVVVAIVGLIIWSLVDPRKTIESPRKKPGPKRA